jgi:hypothetical protein|tara:strand:- start:441 stop:1550 length:1110 start_codon:yes stop_codon:yes gene_type:complete
MDHSDVSIVVGKPKKLMSAYWFLFLLPGFLSLAGNRRIPNDALGYNSSRFDLLWYLIVLILTIFIGFRYEVGGDWEGYLMVYDRSQLQDFSFARDPGYLLIQWLAEYLGWGIIGVNVICALIFSIGLAIFCRSLPRPLLALAVSIPYLVIVVAMGYTRQGVALGLAMVALVALGRNKNLWFVFWMIIGVTMHKTAVLLLPLAAITATTNRAWTLFWIAIISIGAYYIFLIEMIEVLYKNYVEFASQSSGAAIRIAMSLIPGAIFLLFYKRFKIQKREKYLWLIFSLGSIVLAFLLISFSSASTAIDRLALYLLPLQLVVFSYLPDIFGKKYTTIMLFLIVSYCSLIMFVWLNFASHAYLWVPYKNFIFS